MYAPIVLFVYNRPQHTLQTLEALARNDLAKESVLYIYADGPKPGASIEEVSQIQEVRQMIRTAKWCKEVHIIEAENNQGLANSIVKGVTYVVNKYGSVIVLEDDIVTAKGFLPYMNAALKLYASEEHVMHISGYMYPLKGKLPETFFLNVVTPWGWATWKRAWHHYNNDEHTLMEQLTNCSHFSMHDYNKGFGNEFFEQLQANVNGTLKTWAVKWHTAIYLRKGFCLHPGKSLVKNIGFDNSGTNSGDSNRFEIKRLQKNVSVFTIDIVEQQEVLKKFADFYLEKQKATSNNIIKRFVHRINVFSK